MTRHSYLKFIVLLLIIAGCEEYKYRIEMKPCDFGVERKLTLSNNFPEDKRAAITKLYEKQIEPNIFWGSFDTNLPNDVGGAGFYTTFNTDMGQAAIYSERFGGNDNLNDTLQKIQMAVDRVVDLLIGWLEYELGDDPNFASLKTFCNEKLRSDFKNMAIYFWLSDILREHAESEEIIIRMIHYFIERGYFGPKQMYMTSLAGDEELVLRLIRQLIANKMGYSSDEIAIERLGFLSDFEQVEESMERYIRTTDFFKKAWEVKKLQENDPNAKPPTTSEIFDSTLDGTLFDLDIFEPTYKVEVKLTCPNVPCYANGEWDEQAGQVVWLSEIAEDMKLPTFFYASWSEPNSEYQQEHFGQVVLTGEDLARYCVWRENLDKQEGREWDSFVQSLNPGEDLQERLNAFKFSSDRHKGLDTKQSDLARNTRELILAGLKSEKEKNEETKKQKE